MSEKKLKVVNLFGGPGAGKSTTASGVFSVLKLNGINCELVTEFAKDLTWEERQKTLHNQYYIFGKQYHRLWRLRDKVELVITDSPLLLSLIYASNEPVFKKLVVEAYNQFNNLNYYIQRVKKYNPAGRSQTKEEAIQIDDQIYDKLKSDFTLTNVNGNHNAINSIVTDLIGESKYKFEYIK